MAGKGNSLFAQTGRAGHDQTGCARALGLDSSKLSHGEFNALSRVVYNTDWRSQTFWIPPASEGPWTEVEAAGLAAYLTMS
jgi:hypothetical protein